MHTDRDFRELVLDELVEDPYRAIGPSYGVDLATVAAHAVSAQRRYALRDSVLAALLVTLVVSALVGAASDEASGMGVLEGIIPVLLVAWLVVAGTRFSEGHGVLGAKLSRPAHQIPRPRLVMTAALHSRLAAIESAEAGNVTVFSDYRPFVGSGVVYGRWSFAIDIERGKTDRAGNTRTPEAFGASDLYDALTTSLQGTGIPRLRVDKRLFVHGRDVRSYPTLLSNPYGPPAAHADDALLRQALTLNLESARTYLSVQATGWQGHLVTTVFFRAVRLPSALYVEGTSTALLPLAWEYTVGLRGPRDTRGLVLDALRKGGRQTLPGLLRSPARVVHDTRRRLRARRKVRDARQQVKDGTFDYGAVTSIREQVAGNSPNRYYLEYDRDMYDKVIRERLLQTVLEFLDAHDIETSALAGHLVTINTQNTYNNQQHIDGTVNGPVTQGASTIHGGVNNTTAGSQ